MSANYIRKELLNTTAAASISSAPIALDGCKVGTVQLIVGAGPVGSIQHQVTNVADPASGDWINKGSAIAVSGAQNTAVEFDQKELAYSKFRTVYTRTSGSGSLVVIANLKS